MEPVKPTLVIELNVDCPECGHTFDLVNDTDLNEEGWLLDQVLPDTAWIDAHKEFECDTHCPECSAEFEVKGVDW
ncbi:hypothetical protein [Endozoicomonas sp. Mp262]|uniref:hypothetical protein n=1 Tax=Endozoicomonas sp. Mp262 TaxID=2919499 RepID=UPI0021DAA2C7